MLLRGGAHPLIGLNGSVPAPQLHLDRGRIAALAADLDAAGYTVDRLRTLWGDSADAALVRGDRVPTLRRLGGVDTPAATLARLFVLGVAVEADALDAALPTLTASGASELGLVTLGGATAAPQVDLRPYAVVDAVGVVAWWIASDLGELVSGELPTDHVLGVGGASSTLSALQLPDRVGRVLDLGTGCGIQALHAARTADEVVATDISPRALDFARLNAMLNRVDRIDFRLGSLFDPVAGERFDRIVSNPPFVITPRAVDVPEYDYRDGGLVGDQLVASLVAGLPQHLEPGGIAQLLGNWEYREGRSGLDRAQAWSDGAGLESWLVEREVLDPARYAETWIRDGGTRPGSARFDGLVGAWLDDFDARGVEQIGFGYLLLRRPRGAVRLRRAERVAEVLGDNPAGLGAHLRAALTAHDAVAGLDDEAFLALAMRVADDVTEERSHWPGEEHPTVITLRQGSGFGRSVRADTALAAVVGACDGELTLGAIVDAVAGLLDADADALRRQLMPQLRDLVPTGFLQVPPA